MQGIASTGGSDGDAGPGCELEVALQWLSLLYARDCQPSDALLADGEAGSSGGGAGSDGSTAQRQQQQQARRPGGAAGSGGASQYERMLLQLLQGLQAALPPSSKVMAR